MWYLSYGCAMFLYHLDSQVDLGESLTARTECLCTSNVVRTYTATRLTQI